MGLPSFFVALVYVSGYFGLLFAAFCLACGLYYLAEMAEEYTVFARRALRVGVWIVLAAHGFLWIYERFPFLPLLIGAVSHGAYAMLLVDFPFVKTSSPLFILSSVAFVVSNVSWYRFFANDHELFYQYRLNPTTAVVCFFVAMIWSVPTGLFVSLTINDSVLPGAGTDAPRKGAGEKRRTNLISAIAQRVNDLLGRGKLPQRMDRDW